MKTQMLKTKDANTVPQPVIAITGFDKKFLPNPTMRNPSKGKKGINQTICKLLLILIRSRKLRDRSSDF
jgi:hypothetical protein